MRKCLRDDVSPRIARRGEYGWGGQDGTDFVNFPAENAALLICGILFCVKMPEKIQNMLDRYPVIKDAAVIAMYVLSVSYILSGNFRPFLYGGF